MSNRQRTLGEEVKRLMIKLYDDKTLMEHSRDSNIGYVTLSKIISNNLKQKPQSKTYDKLSDYLNVKRYYLWSLPHNYKLLNINDEKYRKDDE